MRLWLLYILFTIMSAIALPAEAQTRHRRTVSERDTVSALVRAYVDSLQKSRARIDTTYTIDDAYQPDNKYYRLFVPLTFYHNIAHNRFSIDADTADASPIDDVLLDVYFRRPDLVRSTQSQMQVAGPILSPNPQEQPPTVDMVQQAMPKAEDADVDMIDLMVKRPNFWTFKGNFQVNLSQNYYSGNWEGRGENNYTVWNYIRLNANYNNQRNLTWTNMLENTLGVNSSKTDTVHSVKTNSSDLHYLGNLGLKAFKNWEYSLSVEARTKLFRIFQANSNHVTADFGSPLELNVSVGMKYNFKWFKNKLTGYLNLGAFSYDYKYWDRLNLSGSPNAGHHSRQDYGSKFTLNFDVKFIKNLTWKVESNGFTSYHRFYYLCVNKFDFRFNKYLATHLDFYARFDDSRTRDGHHGYWQFRDYLNFGVSLDF